MATISELKKAYNDKLKEISYYTKNPIIDDGLFVNSVDFRNQSSRFSNAGGTITSSTDRRLNIPAKGLVFRRGVKLSVADPKLEMQAEVCSSSTDVDGICENIDDFSGIAQIIPIQNGFQGWLCCKKNCTAKDGDKLKFIANGELDKETGNSKLYIMALSAPVKCNEEVFIIHAKIAGYRATA